MSRWTNTLALAALLTLSGCILLFEPAPPECSSSAQCPSDEWCGVDQECEFFCSDDQDCAGSQVCNDDFECVCRSDSDCFTGQTCSSQRCL